MRNTIYNNLIENKKLYKRTIIFLGFSGLLTFIVALIIYVIDPNIEAMLKSVESKVVEEVTTSTGMKKAGLYIVNNGFKVPMQMLLLALIPIPYLYMMNIIVTVGTVGILFGAILRENIRDGVKLILSTLPYFIVEIMAFCLLAAVLFELNKAIRTKIKNIYQKPHRSAFVMQKSLKIIRVYTILVLPMIIVAALLETYVSDILFNL